ncbi:MAG: FAD-binding oxidoreductase [Candidatus Micrarchaeia archaeon]
MYDKLVDLFGSDKVGTELDNIVYALDASRVEGKSIGVVMAETVEDIKRVVKYANKNDLAVVARGGGTSVTGSVIPQNAMVIDLTRMNRIVEIKEDSAIVEPGITIRRLNEECEKNGVFFPVVPASEECCTVGGAISTNALGLRGIKYGKAENWVKKLEVVDGGGNIINVEGEEARAFCGAEGLLGIIVKAELKLAKMPEKRTLSFHIFARSDYARMMRMVKTYKKNKNVSAIEFINAVARGLMGKEEKGMLIVEFESDEGEISDKKDIEEILKFREDAYPAVAKEGYVWMEDPYVDEEHMYHLLVWLRDRKIPAFGHIGAGVMHPCFRMGDEKLIDAMYEFVIGLGGDINGEHGIGITKRKFATTEYIRRIVELKKKYDVKGIMNRGKVGGVGGFIFGGVACER